MTAKNEKPIDSFVEISKKNRNIKISEDDLKRINDLLEDANTQEAFEDSKLSLVVKTNEKYQESQL